MNLVKYEDTAKDLYIDMLTKLADTPYPKLKIVVDTANGTQTQIIRKLFTNLKLSFDCLNECDIQSSHFTPRDTEKAGAFSDLMREVLIQKADLGIGFDVDGDRVIFIDNLGRFLPGDYSCALLAKASNTKSIVTTIGASNVVDHLGKIVYRTQVGSTYVIAKMHETGSTFGFESNGGGISSEIMYGRDGGSTMIKMLNLLKSSKKSLSTLFDQLPQYHIFRDKFDCAFNDYEKIYAAVREKYSQIKIDDLDGLKVQLNSDEWILFRGSGNAPEFRIFSQSSDPKKVEKLGNDALFWAKSLLGTHEYHTDNPQDSLQVLKSIKLLPNQIEQVLLEISTANIPSSCSIVDNIVVSGMGGSALGGHIIKSLERQTLRIPLIISSNYHLPNFVNEKSLVILSSYSGDTAETISACSEARARGAQIFIITSGGKLAQLANDFDLPHYIFKTTHNPSAQPRMGLGYNIMSVYCLLARCHLIHPIPNLNNLIPLLKSQDSTPYTLTAKRLSGRIVCILASEHLSGVAHDMSNQINENAKNLSFYWELPEANHHLMEGLSFPKTNPENVAFLFLTSKRYHPETTARYAPTQQVLSKNRIPFYTLDFSSQNSFFETMLAIQAGSYLSYYLSQENSVDPGPIPWVDWFKDQL